MESQTSSAVARMRVGAVLVVVTALVVAGVGLSYRVMGGGATRHVCVDLPDAVGLYKGNAVSLMGLTVGRVVAIDQRAGGVRADLAVDDAIELPADVGAVVMDASIVADRRVEFSKPYGGGPVLAADACIPQSRTRTPRGVTQAFAAVDDFLSDLLGKDGAAISKQRTDDIGRLVGVVDKNLAGREGELRALMRDAVTVAGTPSETDAIIRRLIDNTDILASQAMTRWPDLSNVVRTVNDSVLAFTGWAEEFSGTLDSAVRFVPTVANIVHRIGHRLVAIIEVLMPIVQVLAPFAAMIAQFFAKIPGLTRLTDYLFDPATGAFRISWTPPRVAMAPADVAALCATLGRAGRCAAENAARFGLIQMILGGRR